MLKRPGTNQEFSIMRADQKMIYEACSFLRSVFAPLLYDELSRSLEELDKRALRENCEVICMFSQKEMVACMQVEWNNEYLHVNLFGVHQDYRGLGISKRMLAWCEKECRKRKISRIEFETLEDWKSRHRFYQMLGFTRGETFLRHGVCYRKFSKLVT